MDSIRLSPESVERCRATYPEAAAYLEAHDHYVPDSLKDTTRMRAQKAQGLLERMERLKAISGCDALLLVTFDLRSLDVLPLYSNRTIKQAQKLVEALFRRTDVSAFIWKLERGRNGGTHVHALIPADSDLMEFNDYEIVQSGEERKVAQYLCKPADARACGRRIKDLPVWTPEQLDEQRMAFNAATAGRVVNVLFEKAGRHPGQLIGKSPYLQAVHVTAPDRMLGQIVPVKVETAHQNSLSGVLELEPV